MANHSVWIPQPSGPRIKIAECETRQYAELIAAALKAYKPDPVQEEAVQNAIFIDTFKLDPVKAIRETEK